MGAKSLILLAIVIVLISACSKVEKTKPIVTDITGGAVGEVKQEAPKVKEKVEKDEIVAEEIAGEKETAEKKEEEALPPTTPEALPPNTHIITIKDLRLEPKELTIHRGDKVIWKHEDEWEKDEATKHYLAAHTNEFRSPILYYGDSFEHTFNKTGTFTYIDVIYKDRSNLRGKIIVE